MSEGRFRGPLQARKAMLIKAFRSIILLLTVMWGGFLTAQHSMKTRDLRELAAVQSYMSLQKFDEAEANLARLLKKYPDAAELYYLSGEISSYKHDYPAAIASIEIGLKVDREESPRPYLMLGDIYTDAGQYVDALKCYENFLTILKRSNKVSAIARAEALVDQARTVANLAADPYPFTPMPVAGGINTPGSLEYFPSLSVDGKHMVFTRRVGRRQEDFYQSELLPDGNWSEAVPLRGINTDLNEGAQTITADGNYLIFTGCGRTDGFGSCDLYVSERVADQWSKAKNLGPSLNSLASESQPSLSRDGSLLFFASNRDGGMGNDDIYVSGRLPDGEWSRPVNLGPIVNTSGNDRYPYWAADNKTLYFTSNGRPGMGGADLFKTSVDESNKWEEPTNLGYPINTPGEETNLFIALDGMTAYFSKGVESDIDIYSFTLPEKVRPTPATYISVRVVDDATGRPLIAAVRLQPLQSGGQVSHSTTGEGGEWLTVLPTGTDYGFSVEKKGYLFYSDRFTLSGDYSSTKPFEVNVRLQAVGEDAFAEEADDDGAIVLRNVFFETASDSLLPISAEELDRLVSLLADREDLGVEIAGHTDDVGTKSSNQQLSERRASSVKSYLVENGIAGERIMAVGYGELRPIATNTTENGRASNRRTTFRLLF